MPDAVCWMVDGGCWMGYWMLDGQHATSRGRGAGEQGEVATTSGFQFPFQVPNVDVCGTAKMYSFWDVFNFSLKSLSDVVRFFFFSLFFSYFYFFARFPAGSKAVAPLCLPSLAAPFASFAFLMEFRR